LLGVLPSEDEDVPASIKGAVTFDQDVFADLEVCPAFKAKAAEMQMVCIRSAKNIRVRPR
jgi:hypothetical protein